MNLWDRIPIVNGLPEFYYNGTRKEGSLYAYCTAVLRKHGPTKHAKRLMELVEGVDVLRCDAVSSPRKTAIWFIFHLSDGRMAALGPNRRGMYPRWIASYLPVGHVWEHAGGSMIRRGPRRVRHRNWDCWVSEVAK